MTALRRMIWSMAGPLLIIAVSASCGFVLGVALAHPN